jgi:hypothetical protein
MRIKNLIEGLNAQQRSVPQLPAKARARHISVLGAKTDPKHPFAGYMVGADESAEPGKKSIGPDRNDPYEKGWRAGFRHNESNPYPAGSKEAQQWDRGYAEAEAQPRHYDESVESDMPDLEEVGEPVESIMDAERRMAAGDRIFVAHEMDEEPFEVHNVGDLKGYTYDQMLAVPQGVTEDDVDEGWKSKLAGAALAGAAAFGGGGAQAQTTAPTGVNATGNNAAIVQSLVNPVAQQRFAKMHADTTAKLTDPRYTHNPDALAQHQAAPKQTHAEWIENVKNAAEFNNPYQIIRIALNMAGVTPQEVLQNLPKGYKLPTTEPKTAPVRLPGDPGYVREGAAEERNELDTPAVQAALAKMAERHKGEKWSKEQLAALGKRIAARGQKPVKEDDVADFLARGGKITQVKPNRGPRNPGLSLGSRHIGGGGDGARASRTGRGSKPQGKPVVAVEADVDEGWKSKLAGAALAGAAALGGGGAASAHDHGDYGHYDQRLDDRSWDTAGYDDHIKSDTKLTKTTTPDGKVSRDSQRRISSVQGPNAQGEYRVFVGQNGKIVSSYITKTPPQNWMVKEDVTKEDIITKLKARLGDYLSDIGKEIKKDPDLVDKLAAKAPGDQMGPPVKTVTTDDGHQIQIHGNEDDGFRISIKNKQSASKFKNLDEAVMACEMYCAQRRKQAESADYIDEAGKDACYHKVKSRYKIWPSAYASGALVRCRKVGADNWGNKSKK